MLRVIPRDLSAAVAIAREELAALVGLAHMAGYYGVQAAARRCPAAARVVNAAMRGDGLRVAFDEARWRAITGSIHAVRGAIDWSRPYRYAVADFIEKLTQQT